MRLADMAMKSSICVVDQVEAKFIDNLKDVTQVQQGKIESIGRLPDLVLYLQVYPKNENSLDQQVDDDKPNQGGKEDTLAHAVKIRQSTGVETKRPASARGPLTGITHNFIISKQTLV